MLLLLLACTSPSPDPPEVAAEAVAEVTTPPAPTPPFEAVPRDIQLVPSVAAATRVLEDEGLASTVADLARDRTWRTKVIVARIAAARTGAELGDLFMEAGVQDVPTLLARLDRIRKGLASVRADGPLLQDVDRLSAMLQAGGALDRFVAELDALGPQLPERLRDHLGERLMPMAVACGWMEATWLYTAAMQRTGRYDQGLRRLVDHRARRYFLDYLDTLGPTELPPSTVQAARKAVDLVRSERDLGPQEIDALHEALDGLLGML